MGLLDRFRKTPEEERNYPLSLNEYLSYGGIMYALSGQPTLKGKAEPIAHDFEGLVAGAYKSNGVVFACMLVRQLLFSDARFQFRRMSNGRPGDLFGTPTLAPLETPWPGATTGDLLTRMIQDADLAGNAFVVRFGNTLKRLRPDWVEIILDADNGDAEAEVVGYRYKPGGPSDSRDWEFYVAEQVAHFAPIPDPVASFRGMSWLTPVLREIQADKAMSAHKESSMINGATPNMIMKLDVANMEKFDALRRKFSQDHEGSQNASKTLFISSGMDATVVGSSFREADFKNVQGAGETRIAAAAGVPPVIVGLSEGLQAATYSNYGQARRRFADGTMRPLWRNVSGSLARIIDVPGGANLWYDDRDIAFLKEDMKDLADIQSVQAQSIKALIDAGFEPDTAVASITSNDFEKLEHTGLFSVQLQPPGTSMPSSSTAITVGEPQQQPDQGAQQLAFASIVAALERKSEVNVSTPEITVNPSPVTVFNKTVEEEDLRSFAQSLQPAEVKVELDAVAKMIGEVEARRILDTERAELAATEAAVEAEKRHRELIEELRPLPPAKMVRTVKRDKNGLVELIVDEPESEHG